MKCRECGRVGNEGALKKETRFGVVFDFLKVKRKAIGG